MSRAQFTRSREDRRVFIDAMTPVMRLVPMATWLALKRGEWVEVLSAAEEIEYLDAAEAAVDRLISLAASASLLGP